MRLTRHSWKFPGRQNGVALVITVILISVITFMAVTFLTVSRRQKGAVTTSTDQLTARFAADAGLQRAQAEMLAAILASTNAFNFDLLVSTNFINRNGFDPGAADYATNVNYDNRVGGGALTANDALENLAHLLYSPRPPVFLTNRAAANSYEFRFYMDLNRNGRYDPSGFWAVTNQSKQVIVSNSVVTNFFVGDPDWIGILDRPDRPHSATNFFRARYAYYALPVGKTLDVNYIYDHAKTTPTNGDGFFRNQGVGAWEINLAAFLADLNTNFWWGPNAINYNYNTNPLFSSSGSAFVNANSLLSYRYNGSYFNLWRADALFPFNAAAFRADNIDGYSDGPLMIGTSNINESINRDNPTRPWPGADNSNHFFTPQEFFDSAKTSINNPGNNSNFTDRLLMAGVTTNSSYDRYTYYRLLAQLGTDSAPEDPGKINLNYDNLVQTNSRGIASGTNLYTWRSVDFFTSAADRLLKTYTAEWLAADYNYFTNHFQVNNAFGINSAAGFTNIPVFVNGRMVYSPVVHRVLQMAANIWDAKTNHQDPAGPLPTVFQPLFTVTNNNVFISAFREVEKTNDLQRVSRPPLDLTVSTNLPSPFLADELIYGVPLVVGARKGLPNFNECSMDSVFTITRKIELVKRAPGSQVMISQTNQLFTMNVSLASGVEFWNSYRSNYARPVDILVNSRVTLSLIDSNHPSTSPIVKTVPVPGSMGTNNWSGWKDATRDGSFMVPLRTNISFFVPQGVAYRPGIGDFKGINNAVYEADSRLLLPQWHLSVTNRVQAMIVERGTGRIIDYVLLGDMNSHFDFAREIGQDPSRVNPVNPFKGLWGTNAIGLLLSGQPGIVQQILASRGNFGNLDSREWTDEGSFIGNRPAEIAKFKAFFTPDHKATYTDPQTGLVYAGSNDTLSAYAPYNPSVTVTVPMSWQANDPLVHYIARDMLYLIEGKPPEPLRIKPPGDTNQLAATILKDIGFKNKRYRPWSVDPGAKQTDPDVSNPALKDPLMTSSDEWQFPTNAFPNIGWLGRIHRGTPWQTIYMKASDLGIQPQTFPTILNSPTLWGTIYAASATKWSDWTGNTEKEEGFFTRPAADRVLFDQFTTAFNDNAVRGQLSINLGSPKTNNYPNLPNVDGLAAWSALFSGVVVLTNSTPDTLLAQPIFDPLIIQPAGNYDPANSNAWPALVKIVAGINAERLRKNSTGQFIHRGGSFDHVGDILSVPELTDGSPFLNPKGYALLRGMNDAAYEWLPQQVMSLLRLGETRFVVYSFGQTLRPANRSIVTSGQFFGMCTNYQITAEVATRAVVRIEGAPTNSHAVVESYNVLPPD